MRSKNRKQRPARPSPSRPGSAAHPVSFPPSPRISVRSLLSALAAPVAATLASLAVAADEPERSSALWGGEGERWTPASRLPDFSHAGFRRGEAPLPEIARGRSVRDFGALGDGKHDDTEAFRKAIAETEAGAVEVPPGRYRIGGLLRIARSGVVLRGAGPDRSILVFPTPLNEIEPNWGATTTGRRTSNYSWSGGFVTLQGDFRSRDLARVAAPARRGESAVRVDSTKGLAPGAEVEIAQSDAPDNSLAKHLYSGDSGPVDNLKGRARTSHVVRIVALEGDRVVFDRPLRTDLRPEWKPRLRAFEPTVTESGVEGLAFEFPATPYEGHFTELGRNPVAFARVAHCWARNLRFVNPDSGIFVNGAFNTLSGIVMESARTPDSQGCTGHHGITLTGTDNLATGFDLRTRFIHDLTVSGFCSGNVFSAGRGVDLSLDHHRYAPHENLFTDLDAGEGSRLWKCGGGAALGKHCGDRGTFWNIRSIRPLAPAPESFGPPSLNLVALQTDRPSLADPGGRWFEVFAQGRIVPANLHEAQRSKRLARNAPSAAAPARGASAPAR